MEKDIYDLIRDMMSSGEIKIGFHRFRNQIPLLNRLRSIGIKKRFYENTRQFVRRKITDSRSAFDVCRDLIIVQTIHSGREHFWDGHGNIRPRRDWHEADIIINVSPSIGSIFIDTFGASELET